MYDIFQGNPYKRIRCLSLARYPDASLRDPTFLMTLPSNQSYVTPYIRLTIYSRELIKDVNGIPGHRNSMLLHGTLGYLSAEARLFVWRSLLHCIDTKSLDGLWQYDRGLGSPFRLSSFYFGCGRRGLFLDSVENVRLVSSQIKAEYDHVFLCIRTFRFNYTESLSTFLHRLGETY